MSTIGVSASRRKNPQGGPLFPMSRSREMAEALERCPGRYQLDPSNNDRNYASNMKQTIC